MYLHEVRLARVIVAFEPRFFFLWSKYYVCFGIGSICVMLVREA